MPIMKLLKPSFMKAGCVTLIVCISMVFVQAQEQAASQRTRAIQGNIRLGGDITQWETPAQL